MTPLNRIRKWIADGKITTTELRRLLDTLTVYARRGRKAAPRCPCGRYAMTERTRARYARHWEGQCGY